MSTSAGPALIDAFTADVDRLRSAEPDVRRDIPDSVHQMRVATRRLRSLLKSYRGVLRRKRVEELGDELRWLAGLLGVARDAEVRADRFEELLGANGTLLGVDAGGASGEKGKKPASKKADKPASKKKGGKKTGAERTTGTKPAASAASAADAKPAAEPSDGAKTISASADEKPAHTQPTAAEKSDGAPEAGPGREAIVKPVAPEPVPALAVEQADPEKPGENPAAKKVAARKTALKAVKDAPAGKKTPAKKTPAEKRPPLKVVSTETESTSPSPRPAGLKAVADEPVSNAAPKEPTILRAVTADPAPDKPAKKAPAKSTAAKKAPARKSSAARSTAARVTAKKAAPEPVPAEPTTPKPAEAAERPARKTAKKAPAPTSEPTPAKKTPPRKPTILRAVPENPATGLFVEEPPAKKTAPRKSPTAKATAARVTADKAAAQEKTPTERPATTSGPAKATKKAASKTAASKTAEKKASASKTEPSTAKPAPAKKTTASKASEAKAPTAMSAKAPSPAETPQPATDIPSIATAETEAAKLGTNGDAGKPDTDIKAAGADVTSKGSKSGSEGKAASADATVKHSKSEASGKSENGGTAKAAGSKASKPAGEVRKPTTEGGKARGARNAAEPGHDPEAAKRADNGSTEEVGEKADVRRKGGARGDFGARLVAEERARYAAALQEAVAAFDGRRYRRLLEQLGVLTSKKAIKGKAGRKRADKVFAEVLRGDFRRLRRLVRAEAKTGARLPEAERIELLHDIRKAAKRLRYSADAATDVLGAPAADLAKHAKKLQTVLGDHRDAIEALQTLRTHAEAADSAAYKRLCAAEQSAAAEALKRYPATTKFLRKRPL